MQASAPVTSERIVAQALADMQGQTPIGNVYIPVTATPSSVPLELATVWSTLSAEVRAMITTYGERKHAEGVREGSEKNKEILENIGKPFVAVVPESFLTFMNQTWLNSRRFRVL